jgi:hypothetical protein
MYAMCSGFSGFLKWVETTGFFGRGGGDRKQYRVESKGLRRNAGEC